MPPTRGMKVLGTVLALLVIVFVAMSLQHRGARHEVEILFATGSGSHLQLSLAGCNLSGYEHHIESSPTRVTIRVTVPGRSNEDCSDGLDLTLEEPLGDRELIDAATGEPIPMNP